jgi:ribosomal protein L32
VRKKGHSSHGQMPKDAGICEATGKEQMTKSRAKSTAKRLSKRTGRKTGTSQMAYECLSCGKWHAGHRPKRSRYA